MHFEFYAEFKTFNVPTELINIKNCENNSIFNALY